LIVEQVVSLMINHAEILSWNQPVLNIRVMFLAQGHNGSLWWVSNSQLMGQTLFCCFE